MLAHNASQRGPTRIQHFFALIDIPSQFSSCSHLSKCFCGTHTDGATSIVISIHDNQWFLTKRKTVRNIIHVDGKQVRRQYRALHDTIIQFKKLRKYRLPSEGERMLKCPGALKGHHDLMSFINNAIHLLLVSNLERQIFPESRPIFS